ncbi:hypothetical protein HELRODRAFT_164017 [Helobdella robusta]|uniref:Uncharacterized protein n=1 Tax=Helobdella robusta TaxID=6412 RepID=T1EUR9_HELRO|nr:hypothetical protein HELRODRAFT_164017 [Helobdella robusta]ESN94218.1 hypothetical protein HELRODRAFT_164017 [Helobdella robusta]
MCKYKVHANQPEKQTNAFILWTELFNKLPLLATISNLIHKLATSDQLLFSKEEHTAHNELLSMRGTPQDASRLMQKFKLFLRKNIVRNDQLKFPSITLTSTLNTTPHINNIIKKGLQTLYARKTLRSHEHKDIKLFIVSFIIFGEKYAAKLFTTIKSTCHPNLQHVRHPSINKINSNCHHVIHPLQPPIKITPHNLRQ